MPRDESTFPDDHFIEVDDTPNYTTSNAKLNYANNSKSDPLQGNYKITNHFGKLSLIINYFYSYK